MKKNRSNRFTQGIVITNNTNDQRFLFFEIDLISYDNNHEIFNKIIGVYQRFGLDVLKHRTHNGWHWISPTLLEGGFRPWWWHKCAVIEGIFQLIDLRDTTPSPRDPTPGPSASMTSLGK